MTQKELGWKSGLDSSYVSRIESGRIKPEMLLMSRLAEAFDMDINEVMSGTDEYLPMMKFMDARLGLLELLGKIRGKEIRVKRRILKRIGRKPYDWAKQKGIPLKNIIGSLEKGGMPNPDDLLKLSSELATTLENLILDEYNVSKTRDRDFRYAEKKRNPQIGVAESPAEPSIRAGIYTEIIEEADQDDHPLLNRPDDLQYSLGLRREERKTHKVEPKTEEKRHPKTASLDDLERLNAALSLALGKSTSIMVEGRPDYAQKISIPFSDLKYLSRFHQQAGKIIHHIIYGKEETESPQAR